VPNPGRPIRSGMPPYNDENMILLAAAARAWSRPAEAATFDARSMAFHRAMGVGRSEAVSAAQALRQSANALSARFAAAPFNRDQAFAVIDAIASDAISERFTDYAGSAQSVMALDTLLGGMVNSGMVTAGGAGALRLHINQGLCRRARSQWLPAHRFPPRAGRCRPFDPEFALMHLPLAFRQTTAIALSLSLALAGCGGGDLGSGGTGTPSPTPSPTTAARFFADPAQEALTAAEVQQIIAQAAGEAQARSKPAIISVVDRLGNVLAVFRMNGSPTRMITSRRTATGRIAIPGIDAQGLDVDATMGAISKAITGAYLSSSGNAFTTRTASMIVQEHFPPAPNTPGLEAGPLFGVQFSQLPCSHLNTRFAAGNTGSGAFIGPKRSPLGLAADPGGLPLYENGVVVGGIGVMADGDYGYDPDVSDIDEDDEEYIALAGIQGFAPSDEIRGRSGSRRTARRCVLPMPRPSRLARCRPALPRSTPFSAR